MTGSKKLSYTFGDFVDSNLSEAPHKTVPGKKFFFFGRIMLLVCQTENKPEQSSECG